jgi:CheY-like chemotaxis protein
LDLYGARLKREDLTKMDEAKSQWRILVVEDEAKVARALQEGLEREKYEVVVAPTGEDAGEDRGHASITISSRYVHPSEDAALDAISRLSGHRIGHNR